MFGVLLSSLVNVVSAVLKPVVVAIETTIGVVAKCGAYVTEKAAEFLRNVDSNHPELCTSLEKTSSFLNDVGDYLLGIGRNLNIREFDDCNCEELGAKTMLSETRERRTDETAIEYIDYLNDIELDKNEFDGWDLEKKVASSVVGGALAAEAIKEKTGVEIPVDFAVNMEKANVKYEEVAKLIEEFNMEGKESMQEMNDFFSNAPSLTEAKAEKIEAIAMEALKKSDSGMTDEMASDRIQAIQIAVQDMDS